MGKPCNKHFISIHVQFAFRGPVTQEALLTMHILPAAGQGCCLKVESMARQRNTLKLQTGEAEMDSRPVRGSHQSWHCCRVWQCRSQQASVNKFLPVRGHVEAELFDEERTTIADGLTTEFRVELACAT